VQEIIWILSAVIAFTLIYKVYSYKQWKTAKPTFVLFPKYIANYSLETKNVIANIKDMGFELKERNNNIFVRGKSYGDFSAKWMKLEIQINKEIKVFAPFFGIVFDNGDLWKIISKAIGSAKN